MGHRKFFKTDAFLKNPDVQNLQEVSKIYRHYQDVD